jgi:hypothetical protein
MVSERWARTAAALLLAAASLAGCKEDRETQVTVAITSETKVPEEIDKLEVVVTDGEGSERSRILHDVKFQTFFPATLAIIPEGSGSIGEPVQVDIRAVKGPVNMVLRRSVVSFVEGRTLLLPMPLRMACFSVESCGATQTCAGGECVDADVEEDKLPDFDPALVFPADAGEECFDEEACLPESEPVPLGDPVACTFELKSADAVNVSVEWAAAAGRVIALDSNDPLEGWTRVDDVTGQLSPGVCRLLNDQASPNRALSVYVSTVCPPKRVNQPYCDRGNGGGVGAKLVTP